MIVLGIDVGTSAVKALLAEDGIVVAEAEVAIRTERPRAGWSEQDPDGWWDAVVASLGRLRADAPKAYASTAGIGLSGQMHGVVLAGADDRPLAPTIIWNDGRAEGAAHRLNALLPDLGRIAGVPAMAGLAAAKLLWIKENQPDLLARTRRLVPVKDWIRLKLCGEHATDMCEAAGTLLLDEARRDWWRPVVEATGLDPAVLPRLVEGPDPAGLLRADMAADLGLPVGCVVAGGAGDAAAGAIGIGAVADGDAFISLGTSSQLFVTGNAYRPHPEALVHAFAHGLPDRWFQMGAMLNGGSPMAWLAGVLGRDIQGLFAAVGEGEKPVSPVTALPYLTGERTPHDDPYARGVLFGMDGGTTAIDIAQAVMEATAFTLVDADDALAVAGARPGALALVGGGSRSPLWVEIIASALDRPIALYRGGAKGPAFGAARLARMAVTGEDAAAVCVRPEVERVVEPNPMRRDALRDRLPLWRDLYTTLKPLFRR